MKQSLNPGAIEAIRRALGLEHPATKARGEEALAKAGEDLNDVINFRVNDGLKQEFENLCKANHTTVSRELKRFMSAAIFTQKLI